MQVVLFVDDKTVSKGMVKYATSIPRESFVDVYGEVHVPETPVVGCTCSKAGPLDPRTGQTYLDPTPDVANRPCQRDIS